MSGLYNRSMQDVSRQSQRETRGSPYSVCIYRRLTLHLYSLPFAPLSAPLPVRDPAKTDGNTTSSKAEEANVAVATFRRPTHRAQN